MNLRDVIDKPKGFALHMQYLEMLLQMECIEPGSTAVKYMGRVEDELSKAGCGLGAYYFKRPKEPKPSEIEHARSNEI
jgi:hypothetical protein